MLCIVAYDIARDNINGIILPNGRCIYTNKHFHDTLQISIRFTSINKIIQGVSFISYLYYTYQLNKDISNPAILERQQSLLHAMGAVVGFSYIMFAIVLTLNLDLVVYGILAS